MEGEMNAQSIWSRFRSFAFEYETPKIVHIENKKYGVTHRVLQLIIVVIVLGYSVIYKKAYQNTEVVTGSVTIKLKGFDVLNVSDEPFMQNCVNTAGPQVFDPADYVIPPQEPYSFFVMTNMWVTCNQTYGVCGEDPSVNCGGDCTQQCNNTNASGPRTGTYNNDTSSCNVFAWCPTEKENSTYTKLGPKIRADEFTVSLKNSIQFPTLLPNYENTNYISNSDLSSCKLWSPEQPYCPIFRLKDIVAMYNESANFSDLATQGAVIVLYIYWDCDLDFDICYPQYSAARLDAVSPADAPYGGFNFRFAKFWYDNHGTQYRTLIKAYGILFIVDLSGQGGKFSFSNLVFALGSVIAWLSIAAILTDWILLHVAKKRGYYSKTKVLKVHEKERKTRMDSNDFESSVYYEKMEESES